MGLNFKAALCTEAGKIGLLWDEVLDDTVQYSLLFAGNNSFSSKVISHLPLAGGVHYHKFLDILVAYVNIQKALPSVY